MAMTAGVAPGDGSSRPATGSGFGPIDGGGLDPARTRGRGSRDTLRSFATAALLGWRMEANWTDPVLFLIYSVAKPVSAALILVVMVEVIAGAAGRELRGFVVAGTALWAFVQGGVAGLALSVLDDRERYRMLKYVYVSPAGFLVVLVGRGVARVAVGAMGAAITLVVGVVVLGVGFDLTAVDWPILAADMLVGLVSVTALGVVLAAICLQTRQESWSYPEAVAGALFLVSGAVFPLSVLPSAVQAIGLAVPLTWWIEGVRGALFPAAVSSIGGAGSLFSELTGAVRPSALETLLALSVTGTVATLGAAVLFRASERSAKDRGLLDQTTGS